jgi:hypothetical protein
VSQFNPTIRVVHPNDEPDLLAGAVLNSLAQAPYRKLSIGLAPSLILSILTLGFVPIIATMRRLRGFIAIQEQQFWHLAEWMRLQAGDADAGELQKAARQIRFNVTLAAMTGLPLLFAIGALAMHYTDRPFDLDNLFRFIYRMPDTREALFFDLAISAAAVCNWAHLVWHQQNVERYLRWFNLIVSRRENLPEVPLPRLELGLWPLWIIAGLVLAMSGALWGIPVMLAAGAHRRYIRNIDPPTRAALAERLRSMLLQRRPAVRVPKPVVVERICVRPNCRSPLQMTASFCPRCGTRVARVMDVVA